MSKIRIAERGRLPCLLGRLGAYYAKSGNAAEAKKLVDGLREDPRFKKVLKEIGFE